MVVLGIRVDSSGSFYTALQHRQICAEASWAKLTNAVNIKRLTIANKRKGFSSTFGSSLTYGLASFPLDGTACNKIQSIVSNAALCAVPLRVSSHPTLQIAHLRRREEPKDLKRRAILGDPLLKIASQRFLLTSIPPYLQGLLEYRTLEWSRSVSLASRPARTRGGRILCLMEQLQVEAEEFSKSP